MTQKMTTKNNMKNLKVDYLKVPKNDLGYMANKLYGQRLITKEDLKLTIDERLKVGGKIFKRF